MKHLHSEMINKCFQMQEPLETWQEMSLEGLPGVLHRVPQVRMCESHLSLLLCMSILNYTLNLVRLQTVTHFSVDS